MKNAQWTWLVLALVGEVSGCVDKAKEPYDLCVKDEAQGNVDQAIDHCQSASKADPETTSGKAASAKLPALFEKKREEAEKERATLLSGGLAELKSLVAKYPESVEAGEARDKIATLESLCANLDTWTLARSIDCEGVKPGPRGMTPAACVASLANLADSAWRTMENTDPSKQEGVLSMLAQTGPDREVTSLAKTEVIIRDHAARPGEEAIRQSLVDDYERVMDANRKWAEVMRAYRTKGGHTGNIESIAAMVSRTKEEVIPPLKAGERKRGDQCRTLTSSPSPVPVADAGGSQDAAGTTTAARAEALHDPADVAFAKGFVGKNIVLLLNEFKKHPSVNERFTRMMGPAYKVVSSPGVAFPIAKSGDAIVAEGCPPHLCGGTANFIVVVDLVAGTLHSGVMSDGKPRIYSEDVKNAPALLSAWKKNPTGWRQ